MLRRVLRSRAVTVLIGWVGAGAIRLLACTWRVRIEGADPRASGEPFVGVLWHRGFLIAAGAFRDSGLAVPVSRSRDGDRIAAVLRGLGFGDPPRGSSSRGARQLLVQLIRRARRGDSLAILPDGPRGPARELKPGVVAVARATGRPVVPVGLSARPSVRVGSWDRALLPLPFARVRVVVGTPLRVPEGARNAELVQRGLALERELDRVTDRADACLGLPADPPRRQER